MYAIYVIHVRNIFYIKKQFNFNKRIKFSADDRIFRMILNGDSLIMLNVLPPYLSTTEPKRDRWKKKLDESTNTFRQV